MADVRSKLFANYFLWNFGFIYLFISFFPTPPFSVFRYVCHHFPSLVTPYLSYLYVFVLHTPRSYTIFFYFYVFLCIIFLSQFT